MNDFLPNNKYQLIGFIIFTCAQLISEYWLGKTQKVHPNSILDLIFQIVKSFACKLFSWRKK